MTVTGTQNRPYTSDKLPVVAILRVPGGVDRVLKFDWNDWAAVRYFAAQSDDCIRAGGSTTLQGGK